MAITVEKDRRTRKETIICEGTVTGVFIDPLKTVKSYSSPKGQNWTPTHNINIVVDGDRIGLGMTDKPDNLRVKNVEDNYVDFGKGLEITVVVEEAGEYNGKTQYRGKLSDVCVVGGELVTTRQQEPKQNTPSAYQGKPRDTSGMEVGHALNVAFDFLGHSTMKGSIECAKTVHDITQTLKAAYGAAHPDLSAYDVGAAVGHAIQNAAKFAKTKGQSIDTIAETATTILDKIVPAVTEHVKAKTTNAAKTKPKPQEDALEEEVVDSPVEAEAPAEEAVKAPAVPIKAPKKAATRAPKVTPKIVEPTEDTFDDDLPF